MYARKRREVEACCVAAVLASSILLRLYDVTLSIILPCHCPLFTDICEDAKGIDNIIMVSGLVSAETDTI